MVHTNLKVANKGQIERFTVRSLSKFSFLYEFEQVNIQMVGLHLHRFDCHMQVASYTSTRKSVGSHRSWFIVFT